MRPCDCTSMTEAMFKLNEQGLCINNDSIHVIPGNVVLSLGLTTIKIPMAKFKRFAEWYLEDQIKED